MKPKLRHFLFVHTVQAPDQDRCSVCKFSPLCCRVGAHGGRRNLRADGHRGEGRGGTGRRPLLLLRRDRSPALGAVLRGVWSQSAKGVVREGSGVVIVGVMGSAEGGGSEIRPEELCIQD